MLDKLPLEITLNIIKNLESSNNNDSDNIFYKMDFEEILLLKQINKYFFNIINNLSNSWIPIPEKSLGINLKIKSSDKLFENTETKIKIKKERSEKLELFCKKKTSIKTFKWLFDNNINLSLHNIKTLIINNRIDVIKKGFFYKDFLDLMFNKFYIDNTTNNDIFSIKENMNPIIIAAEYNRLDIIKLLLESSSHGNPFINMIPSLVSISIKYTNKSLFSYLINKFPDKVSRELENSISLIILRFQKSEDIIFHLLQNKRIEINRRIISASISKNYFDLFVYCFNNYKNEVINNNQDYIIKSIEVNSVKILNYLLDNNSNINKHIFSSILFKKKKNDKLFIENIIKNHLYLIPNEKSFIRLSVNCGVDIKLLKILIENGYYFNEEDIIDSINNKNIELAKIMINSID